MTATRSKWGIAVLLALGVLGAVVAGGRVGRRPPPERIAGAECASSEQCAPGNRCVAPGVCSHACKTDADCPAGRRCAELRSLETGSEGADAPQTVSTCVVAPPG